MYCNAIISPNFPFNYNNHIDKDFSVEVDAGKRLQIIFSEFNLEANSRCSWDWVTVADGDGTELLPKTCGTNKPTSAIVSKTNRAIVHFHSDYSVTMKGFSAYWKCK